VGAHDFFFALEFSSQGAPASLVEDLASNVFKHCGCSAMHVEGLSDALERAVERDGSDGQRRCDVQFVARNGTLEILVSSNGGRVWQTEIILP
jgi:hypothetical protein